MYVWSRFGEYHRAVTANDADQPVAKHFNTCSNNVSDIKILALHFLVAIAVTVNEMGGRAREMVLDVL